MLDFLTVAIVILMFVIPATGLGFIEYNSAKLDLLVLKFRPMTVRIIAFVKTAVMLAAMIFFVHPQTKNTYPLWLFILFLITFAFGMIVGVESAVVKYRNSNKERTAS